jgi:hypothetical protein
VGCGEAVTWLGRQGRESLWFWPIGVAEGAICSAWTEAEGSHFCYVLVLFCLDVEGGVNLGVGVTGLWRRPGPSMIASDVRVIKGISNRVRSDPSVA